MHKGKQFPLYIAELSARNAIESYLGLYSCPKKYSILTDEMLLGQELKFKNKLYNLKLGTFFSALPGLGAFGPSARA